MKKKMSLSPVVLEEMNRLRTEEKLNVCIDNLAADGPCTTVLTSFNIRSLHKHKEDLEKDLNLMSSDVLALKQDLLKLMKKRHCHYQGIQCIGLTPQNMVPKDPHMVLLFMSRNHSL